MGKSCRQGAFNKPLSLRECVDKHRWKATGRRPSGTQHSETLSPTFPKVWPISWASHVHQSFLLCHIQFSLTKLHPTKDIYLPLMTFTQSLKYSLKSKTKGTFSNNQLCKHIHVKVHGNIELTYSCLSLCASPHRSVYPPRPIRPPSFPSNLPGLRKCSDVAVSFPKPLADKRGKIGLLSQISLPLSLNFPLPWPSCPLLRDQRGKRGYGFTRRKMGTTGWKKGWKKGRDEERKLGRMSERKKKEIW